MRWETTSALKTMWQLSETPSTKLWLLLLVMTARRNTKHVTVTPLASHLVRHPCRGHSHIIRPLKSAARPTYPSPKAGRNIWQSWWSWSACHRDPRPALATTLSRPLTGFRRCLHHDLPTAHANQCAPHPTSSGRTCNSIQILQMTEQHWSLPQPKVPWASFYLALPPSQGAGARPQRWHCGFPALPWNSTTSLRTESAYGDHRLPKPENPS